MIVSSIGELKEAIENLPDNTPVQGFDGQETFNAIMMYRSSKNIGEVMTVSNGLPAIIGHNWLAEEQ